MLDDGLILNKYQEPSYWQKLSDYWNKMSADQQIYTNNSQKVLESRAQMMEAFNLFFFKSLGQDPVIFIHLAEDKLHDIDDDKACEAAYWEAYHRINKET